MKYLIKNFDDELITEIETIEELEKFMSECPSNNTNCFYWDTTVKEDLSAEGFDTDSIRLIHPVG